MAYDGEQALELVTDDIPDIVVLDLRMPGIDGLEVLDRLKKTIPMCRSLSLLDTVPRKTKRYPNGWEPMMTCKSR
ncbi:MAG: response regulator [Thermodesulfobacteriota bacterium]